MRKLIILSSLLLTVAGCKSNPAPPTIEDAKQIWHHLNTSARLDSDIELVDMKKTDGQMAEINGVKLYTLYYEATERHLAKLGNWKPGDTESISSNYGFQKTEKGWRGPDGELFER